MQSTLSTDPQSIWLNGGTVMVIRPTFASLDVVFREWAELAMTVRRSEMLVISDVEGRAWFRLPDGDFIPRIRGMRFDAFDGDMYLNEEQWQVAQISRRRT